jgi:hypothetical protein
MLKSTINQAQTQQKIKYTRVHPEVGFKRTKEQRCAIWDHSSPKAKAQQIRKKYGSLVLMTDSHYVSNFSIPTYTIRKEEEEALKVYIYNKTRKAWNAYYKKHGIGYKKNQKGERYDQTGKHCHISNRKNNQGQYLVKEKVCFEIECRRVWNCGESYLLRPGQTCVHCMDELAKWHWHRDIESKYDQQEMVFQSALQRANEKRLSIEYPACGEFEIPWEQLLPKEMPPQIEAAHVVNPKLKESFRAYFDALAKENKALAYS